MNARLSFLVLSCAILFASAAAHAGLVRWVNREELVRASTRIAVGKVTEVRVQQGPCSVDATIRYDVLRTLKGPPSRSGTYRRGYHANNPGCPSGSFRLPRCTVPIFDQSGVGTEAVFLDGGRHGPGCEPADAEPEIRRILATPLTIARLLELLPTCGDSECIYLQEIARHPDALAALRQLLVSRAGTDIHYWALARIGGRKACMVLEDLDHLPAMPESQLIDAIARAGCRELLPRLRAKLPRADAPGYLGFALIDAFARLGDREAVPLLAARLEHPAWHDRVLNVVHALSRIGDARAVPALCRRLARGGFALSAFGDLAQAQRVTALAIRWTVARLGGQCPSK